MTTKHWTRSDLQGWFATRLPEAWFPTEPQVSFDREEILVLGELPAPPSDATDAAPADEVACVARIREFREATRERRVAIAAEAEILVGRKVSWGVRCGAYEVLFTTQSVPVMTRLRMDERNVLDTLIAGGVARSRSEALAWCVRLVGRHQADWIGQLRDAMELVERVRAEGPQDPAP